MMKEQSLDFITGYIFSKLHISIYKHMWTEYRKDPLTESFSVPKIWFGLSSCHSTTNDIVGDKKYEMIQKLQDILNDIYPELETTCERIIPERQYIRFDFKVKYKEQTKKMTLEEIEKELGYKIEIVSDK